MAEELRQEQQHLISVERVKKTLEVQIHELTVSIMSFYSEIYFSFYIPIIKHLFIITLL